MKMATDKITSSNNEVMFSPVFVCLFVSQQDYCKLLDRLSQNAAEKWPQKKPLHSAGNQHHIMFGSGL